MKFLKTIIITTSLLVSSLLLTGCMENFLDRNPYGELDENTYFTQSEHANLSAVAAYSTLRKQNLHWADAQLELAMTGDFSSGGFKDAQSYYTASFNPNDGNLVKGIWQRAYEGISLCNNNIERIEGMPKEVIQDKERNLYLSELRFIRAYWYFRLIRFYGDVPLKSSVVTDPKSSEQVMLPLTPKAEIISKMIVPDLEFALKYLPTSWDKSETMRATKGAALALMTELYVTTKEYDKAIQYGEQINNLGYKMIENPGDVLRVDYENSSEIIFSVGYTGGMETYREFYYGTIEVLEGDLGRIMRGDTYSGDYFYASEDLINFYQSIDGKPITESPYYDESVPWKYRDPRFDTTFFTPMDEITTTSNKTLQWKEEWLVNDVTGYDIQKRGVYYGENSWNKRVNFTIIRLPRVYLLLAEAYALKANPDFNKVNYYLNKSRTRAREYALANPKKYLPEGMSANDVLPNYKVKSSTEAMAAINYESRVEFFTEDCIRYYDLKRWGKLGEEWSKVGQFTWSNHLLDLPYPNAELSSNNNIKQKAGWGN